jgi:hypothetical protein
MNETIKDSEVLLVKEKDSDRLGVVTGLNKDGTPRAVNPEPENEPAFLKIDRHGDALENFMTNFLRQCKNPTHFHFFKAPPELIDTVIPTLQHLLKNPDAPSNKEKLNMYRVLPEAFAPKPYQAIDASRIDWSQFEQLGVKREMIDAKSLESMLNRGKTPSLLPVKAVVGDTVIHTDARLSLRETADGRLNLMVHAVRKEPQLEGFVYGTKLSEEDKRTLRQTGHAGRLVEIEPVKGQKMPAFLSVDKLTNELVAVRADRIRIPNEIKGVVLDDEQKKSLSEGKAVYLEGMKAKNGNDFSATVQINADRRSIEFRFDTAKLSQQHPQENLKFRLPDRLLGVELSKEQQQNLRENRTVYVTGMTDKAGEPFDAYIRVNTEKGKLDFFKWNPDRAQQVTPGTDSRTQVAVNSEGKTHEATKKGNEPLKQGQSRPDEKQQQKQVEKNAQKEKKSNGMKM